MTPSPRQAKSKSKADFFLEGQRAARSMNTFSKTTGVHVMPPFGCSDSWQSRAFAVGFRAEANQIALTRQIEKDRRLTGLAKPYDARYTVQREWVGASKPKWAAWFVMTDWIGAFDTKEAACMATYRHHDDLMAL